MKLYPWESRGKVSLERFSALGLADLHPPHLRYLLEPSEDARGEAAVYDVLDDLVEVLLRDPLLRLLDYDVADVPLRILADAGPGDRDYLYPEALVVLRLLVHDLVDERLAPARERPYEGRRDLVAEQRRVRVVAVHAVDAELQGSEHRHLRRSAHA